MLIVFLKFKLPKTVLLRANLQVFAKNIRIFILHGF